jgi:hypothetical protein
MADITILVAELRQKNIRRGPKRWHRTPTIRSLLSNPGQRMLPRCGQYTDITILIEDDQTLAPYCHHWFDEAPEPKRSLLSVPGQRRPPKSMRTPTRDIRHHPILIEAYGKRSYGDDLKLTINSTHQPKPTEVNQR